MTIGSLFSGIGGLELGLEWAGLGPTVWQVEQDEYCRKILERHWSDATRHEDVCAVGASNLEPVDIICGGFPCQDLSYAGKGAGITGARSGLWTEFARIVRELRPRFVVVENVPALLARGMGGVLGDLATLGYDATWDCIPAAALGAPHLRYRAFIVAYAKDHRPQAHRLPIGATAQLASAGDAPDSDSAELRQQPRRRHGSLWSRALQLAIDGQAETVADSELHGRNRAQEGPYKDGAARPLGEKHEHRQPVRAGAHRVKWDDRRAAESEVGAAPDGLPGRMAWGPGWERDCPRVADDVPERVARLRALGNAVVPQCAQVVGEVVQMLRAAP